MKKQAKYKVGDPVRVGAKFGVVIDVKFNSNHGHLYAVAFNDKEDGAAYFSEQPVVKSNEPYSIVQFKYTEVPF